MKKLIALLLIAVFVCAAVACSDEKEEVSFIVSSRVIADESSEAEISEAESSEAESSEAESSEEEILKAESSEVSVETSDPEKEKAIFGVVVDDLYVNSFANIGFKLKDDWGYAEFELLKELNKIATDAADEQYQEELLKATVFFDMYAAHTSGTYATVVFEKINEEQKAYFTDTSKIYNAATLKNFEQSWKNSGALNAEYEVTTVKVDNRVFDGLHATYIQNGNDVEMYQFVNIVGDYIITCSVHAMNGVVAEDVLDYFEIY